MTLQQSLLQIYKFLLQDKYEFTDEIQQMEEQIKEIKDTWIPMPPTPEQALRKTQAEESFLLFFLWPIGLWKRRQNKKERKAIERKANEDYVRGMQEFNKRRDQLLKELEIVESQLANKKKERENFKVNYGQCLNFLHPSFHSLNAVSYMLSMVAMGRADTKKEAINLYIDHMKRLEDEEKKKEEAELAKQYHKEMMSAYDNIIDNLETANREIKDIKDMHRQAYYRLFR